MNTVIYTEDLEPITVLDLPLWILEELEKRPAKIPVVDRPTKLTNKEPVVAEAIRKYVTLYSLKVTYLKTTKYLIITKDDELALTLEPAWLPGQRASVNDFKDAIGILTDSIRKFMKGKRPDDRI